MLEEEAARQEAQARAKEQVIFPDDLLPGTPGSNSAEVFYGLVPDPDNTTCAVSHAFALLCRVVRSAEACST